MLTFTPTPIEDEWIYSIANRWWLESGLLSYEQFSIAAFGEKTDFLRCNFLPKRGIRSIAGSLTSASLTLKRYSLIPFFRVFQSIEHASALNIDGRKDVSLPKPLEHLTRNRVIRYCAACKTAQLRRCGFPVWLRSHNLPGVGACWIHGSILVEIQLSSYGLDAPLLPPIDSSEPSMLATEVEIRYARLARFLLSSPFAPPKMQHCQAALLTALSSTASIGGRYQFADKFENFSKGIAGGSLTRIFKELSGRRHGKNLRLIGHPLKSGLLSKPEVFLVLVLLAYEENVFGFFTDAWHHQRRATQFLTDVSACARRSLGSRSPRFEDSVLSRPDDDVRCVLASPDS